MNTLEKLDYKKDLLLSPELKRVNPEVFQLLKVNERFKSGVITSLLSIIGNNIIEIGDKTVRISMLTVDELTIRTYGDIKYSNEMKYALETTYKSGLLDDIPTDLLPEYLQKLYKKQK
ncbi:hypothetical protein BUY57_10715 [Staphylococcus epidermidis]|uniref:hypothetical protein n=1 Tax=Staphylococcus epidermidis TaxID=1282 RepID=UPI000D1D0EDD|nr:hypothetical protein [Staphylococcus epidermidis]PTE62100.1 hypothetical protein BUY57_10715 [Staphylococcus epidermidis]